MIDYHKGLPVSKWSNDKTWSVSKVFIRVFELSIANICKAFSLVIVPSMTQLTQPKESLSVFNLLWYQFGDYISSMYINCANGHDLLPVSRWKISNQHVDQGCQLLDLMWGKLQLVTTKNGSILCKICKKNISNEVTATRYRTLYLLATECAIPYFSPQQTSWLKVAWFWDSKLSCDHLKTLSS